MTEEHHPVECWNGTRPEAFISYILFLNEIRGRAIYRMLSTQVCDCGSLLTMGRLDSE